MMTVEERIAQIQQAAAKRGFAKAKEPCRISIVRDVQERDREPRPTKRRDAVLDKPLPEVSPGNKNQVAKLRIAAWLICKALGDGWRKVVENSEYGFAMDVKLQHPSGLTIIMRPSIHQRFSFCLYGCHGGEWTQSITVAANRSPASIAGDLYRRLIADGFQAHRKTQDSRDNSRMEFIERRTRILRVARAGDTKIGKGYDNHHRSDHHAKLNLKGATASASVGYLHRIDMEISVDTETAELIFELLAGRFSKVCPKCGGRGTDRYGHDCCPTEGDDE